MALAAESQGPCWKEGPAASAANANLAGGPSLEGILGPALPSAREQGPGRGGEGWATSPAGSPRTLSPEPAASSCSACCQGCWDSQLPPTLPHPEHEVPSARPQLHFTDPWKGLCMHAPGESSIGVQMCTLPFPHGSSPRKPSHTGSSAHFIPAPHPAPVRGNCRACCPSPRAQA